MESGGADHVDEIVAQWRRERPDLDAGPLATFGRIFRIAALADAALSAGMAPHALQPGWFDILAALRRAGDPCELNPTELMRSTLLSSGGMTKRVDRLADAGLVRRRPDPNDRRGTLVGLTRKGRARFDAALVSHLANEGRLLAALGAADRRTLDRILRKLLVSLEGRPQDERFPRVRSEHKGVHFGIVRDARRRRGSVKRTAILGFICAMSIATVLVAPSAQAATARAPSTVCSFVMKAKFHDGGLVSGDNPHAFFTFDVTMDGCAGSSVSGATGQGGSAGDLVCSNGAIQGVSSAKMQVYWDTGGNSGINFHFDFTRSRYGGKILFGHFKHERVRAQNITFTPTKGDCASSPLLRAQIAGSVSL